jgi:hypothetical protein
MTGETEVCALLPQRVRGVDVSDLADVSEFRMHIPTQRSASPFEISTVRP